MYSKPELVKTLKNRAKRIRRKKRRSLCIRKREVRAPWTVLLGVAPAALLSKLDNSEEMDNTEEDFEAAWDALTIR